MDNQENLPPLHVGCLSCPLLILKDGKMFLRNVLVEGKKYRVGEIPIIEVGDLVAKQINPFAQLVDAQRKLKLDKGAGRVPDLENLPEVAETMIDARTSYRTNRITFETSDWSTNTLLLYVPSTHEFYGAYADDDSPIVQIFQRTGSAGAYIYTQVIADYTITYAFTAAVLTGAVTQADSASDWTGITAGYFTITIDGNTQNISGLNFSGASDMDDVAAVISAGIIGATCTWDTDHFIITSDGTSGNTEVSFTSSTRDVAGTDIATLAYMACNKWQASQTVGINGTWVIEITKDSAISTFNGLIQIG